MGVELDDFIWNQKLFWILKIIKYLWILNKALQANIPKTFGKLASLIFENTMYPANTKAKSGDQIKDLSYFKGVFWLY